MQLADFVTGTIARCFEPSHLSDKRSEFLKTLKERIIEIRLWPPDYQPFAFHPSKDFENYDETIANVGLAMAIEFLKKNDKSDIPAVHDQCSCLRYLHFHFTQINPERYIPTHDLMDHIIGIRGTSISQHYFRSKVIAKLRDKGVLVASSNRGYKLPSSKDDLYAFVNHSNSYIQPMIDRLLRCRNQIKLATKNELDILDHEEFKYLRYVINGIDS